MGAKNVEDIYVLTPAQQGMLVHCLEGGEEGVYFEQLTFTVEGPLDTGAFERAWQTVVDRHPILRSAFVWESLEKPLQGVARRATLPITRLDWREHDGARQDELFQAHLIAERRSGFNLTRPPLMRLSLIQVDEQRHRVVWHYHHLLLDGWSSSIVFNELFVCYRAYGRGEAPALPPARPFRDYIGWLQRQDPRQSEAFWREQLHDFHTATPLVVEQRVEGAAGLGFHELRLTLAAAEGAALHAFARRHQLTLNTLAQAAWALLLSRYSGAPDVVFGVTVSGRPAELPGVEQMVGMFINTLPLRVAVQPEAELLPWLKALQSHQSSLRQHEHSALVQVRKHSAVTPGTPLFESIVVFENYPPEAFASDDSASGLRISEVEPIERTNYPLTFVVMPGEALALYLSYDSRRFAEASVSLMLGHLRELLLSMAAGPLRLCDLSLLSAAEQRQLAAWNATARAYPRQPSLLRPLRGPGRPHARRPRRLLRRPDPQLRRAVRPRQPARPPAAPPRRQAGSAGGGVYGALDRTGRRALRRARRRRRLRADRPELPRRTRRLYARRRPAARAAHPAPHRGGPARPQRDGALPR